MTLPENLPIGFLEKYYENCTERESFNDPVLTKEEYWKIWIEMVEHQESRT